MISKLKKVTIKNLFGDRDVSIDIKDNKLILIADNGSGKTTILKMIYLFLSEQWLKLSQNEFEEMMVLIDDNEIVFNRENFLTVKLSETDKEDLKRIFSYPQCEEALNEIYKYSLDSLTFDIIKNILKNYDALENLAGYILKGIEIRLGRNANLTKFSFPPILYMPTYRRIEKELSTLDVTISKSMNFRNEQYLEFFEFGSDDIQLRIFELLLTYGEEGSQQYTEQHDKVFTLIPEFLVKCSKYFTNSKLTFNEKSKEFIILLRNGEKKSLSILSSGQKQIISFFFYLYFFNVNASPFIIIDEPELSISIDWQERILSDLLESNCSGLVTATHSPFIITDSLKPYTEGLNRYIQERV